MVTETKPSGKLSKAKKPHNSGNTQKQEDAYIGSKETDKMEAMEIEKAVMINKWDDAQDSNMLLNK